MTSNLPDRKGWVTGSLATLPACPPFPQFTALEMQALSKMADLFGDDADEFRRQIDASHVTDRINTVVGFYTRVSIDRTSCKPVLFAGAVEHFDLEGSGYGLDVILSDSDGYLDQIEGVSVDAEPFKGKELAALILR